MMKNRLMTALPALAVLVLVCGMLPLLLTGCIDDGFTTSSGDVLTFSTDTVAFDTVITLQGTATKQMVVYNRSSKQVNISSISVAGIAAKGHFHLNVDGITGDKFENVEIRGNDSIYIFIEAYVDEMGKDDPTLLEDRIDFVTNGVQQQVALTAWGQDVVRLTGDTLTRNTTFTAAKPYLIYDTLYVAPGVTLSIDAGATLLFHDKAAMRVAGRVLAYGTVEAPINLRGDRLDHVVGSISFDIMSGQWGGVIFTPPTMGNELDHVIMKGSSIGMHCSASDTTQCALKLFNCVLHNSSSTCLATADCWVQAIGTEFSDAAEEVAYFAGGKVVMQQCTFANYYLFASLTEPMVSVYDIEYSNGVSKKIKAYFDNCIFYGNTTELNNGDLEGYDVWLRYCLLKSNGENDAHFINCVWNADPMFYTVREDYLFDYRLKNGSDAIGVANPALCPDEAIYDRYGVDRRERQGSVDIGAYAWVPSVEDE